MAKEQAKQEQVEQTSGEPLPPVGEEIHVPGPSILPLITAIGITLMVVGITTVKELSILGSLITVVCVYRWVKSNNEEIDELPLEEHHRH
jgi:hypothetical protein